MRTRDFAMSASRNALESSAYPGLRPPGPDSSRINTLRGMASALHGDAEKSSTKLAINDANVSIALLARQKKNPFAVRVRTELVPLNSRSIKSRIVGFVTIDVDRFETQPSMA